MKGEGTEGRQGGQWEDKGWKWGGEEGEGERKREKGNERKGREKTEKSRRKQEKILKSICLLHYYLARTF